MWNEFKEFLTKANALALAIGFIIGAATGKVVTALTQDIMMPIIGLVLPKGDWRTSSFEIGSTGKSIMYGDFFGAVIDFIAISLVVFLIARALIKPAAPAPVKNCPFCKEGNAVDATRCRACTSEI